MAKPQKQQSSKPEVPRILAIHRLVVFCPSCGIPFARTIANELLCSHPECNLKGMKFRNPDRLIELEPA